MVVVAVRSVVVVAIFFFVPVFLLEGTGEPSAESSSQHNGQGPYSLLFVFFPLKKNRGF